jgi:peptidoglycan/LPS O-acetylase OafA/YrhL
LVGGKALERTMQGSFNIKGYFIDRLFRIMPPLVGTLLLIIAVNSVVGNEISCLVILGNLFSLQGIFIGPAIGPLWSLSYEVWFYILFGVICGYFTTLNRKHNFILLSIFIVSLLVFVKLNYIYLFVWLIGAFIYFIKPTHQRNIFKYLLGLIILLTLFGLQLTSESRSINLGSISSLLKREVLEIVFAVSFSLFMIQIITVKPTKKFAIFFENFGAKLAKFSYSLYLSHAVFINLFEFLFIKEQKQLTISSLLLFGFNIIFCLLGCYLMYILFEKNTDKLKGLFKSNLKFFSS